jgi:hypothetical protein
MTAARITNPLVLLSKLGCTKLSDAASKFAETPTTATCADEVVGLSVNLQGKLASENKRTAMLVKRQASSGTSKTSTVPAGAQRGTPSWSSKP